MTIKIGIDLALIIFLSIILIKSADEVIISIRRIASRSGTGMYAISALILALGTSLPELFVGITSSLEGISNLSLGVVIGSNISNISLVGAFSALIAGSAKISNDYLKRDVAIALVAGVAPILLVLDGQLSRVDGLVLLSVYGVYASGLFKERFAEIARSDRPNIDVFHSVMRKLTHFDGRGTRDYARLFLGITFLLFSADMIVRISKSLALSLNIPILVVGLLILAVGTSLPELAFSIRSLEGHTPSMFYGNLLGSTIVNSTLILGIVGLISPIKIEAFGDYAIAVAMFIVSFCAFWFFVRTKHRLDRWEAAILLLFYALFVAAEFI